MIDSLGGSGGAENGLVREAPLLGDGFDQRVVKLFTRDHLSPALRSVGIDVISFDFPANRAGWLWPMAVLRLVAVIREFRPDVIHSSLFISNMVSQLAARLTDTPVVSTFTLSGDEELLRTTQPGGGSVRAALLRRIAGLAARTEHARFRALTDDAKTTNSALLGVEPARVVVIPRGVPLNLIPERPKSREDLGLPADGMIVLNVGRQTAQKGHTHLLSSMAMLLRSGMSCHLVVVGRSGEASEAIREAIDNHDLGDHVTLVGYTPDVAHFYAHASLFAFSSLMEGLGTAVLEAMASQIPVVAFDIPPVREITDDGRLARLVPVADEEAFALAMREVLEGEGASRVQPAYEWVATHHSLPAVATRLAGLLEEVALSG